MDDKVYFNVLYNYQTLSPYFKKYKLENKIPIIKQIVDNTFFQYEKIQLRKLESSSFTIRCDETRKST
jgi:hypothetical protein